MKLHIKLDKAIDADFTQMAKDAGISCADMAEICVYSVLAGWVDQRQRDGKPVSLAVSPVVDAVQRRPAAL